MDQTGETGSRDTLLARIQLLEFNAWNVFEQADNGRERLAALKVAADLVLAQLKMAGASGGREDENGPDQAEQLRLLDERVRQLAQRRGGCGQEARP